MIHETGTFRMAVLNGVLLEREAIQVSPFSDGFMFGRGVFETIKVAEGEPEHWQDHFKRLQRGAAEVGLGGLSSPEELLDGCRRLIAAERATLAVLKVLVFQDAGGTAALAFLREYPYREHQYSAGFSLHVVHGRAVGEGLARLKTQNYLGNLLALQAARTSGFDEVLFCGAGDALLECATSNVFVVKDGRVLTPPTTVGLLPGVIRARLLREQATPVLIEEAELTLSDLAAADEVFVTNSLLGVMPVRACEGRQFSGFKVAKALRASLA